MGSSVLEHSIKVRKPYTITKQRERWSEDEQGKFLEALKLYGRAWRQIAEHIGSKTAVQIRSHAQKFFTKAVRESKTVEIPPPRPKKKPMHPYPRKLGSLPTVPVMEAFPVLEQDDTLPTSVSSSTSDQMNSCTSPVSSVAGSNPAGTWSCEQEKGCHSATTSVDNEDESLPQQTSDMEQDLGSDNSIPSKEASSMEAQPVSLKLFGKMVMVADPQKQPTSSFEDAEPAVAIDIAQQFPAQARDQSAVDGAPWCSWPNNTGPMFYILPSHGNLAEFAEASVAPMTWVWGLSSWENQSFVRGCSDDGSHVQKECSSTESNSAELSIKAACNHVFGDLALNGRAEVHVKLRRSETSAFTSLKAIPKKDAKGFVPYKRCVAEREAENQKMINGSGGGLQGVQLSL